ncbi:hypothetical protein OIU79_019262 [Salix purpurea]|uniref:Uncharacterized protein n=1 Tax=Salix purpurea TaxID=77065 RepID=A0A9Q0P0P9_SALPP|nr:hypothetical protein OIU79_019262 [Salix purpurea]
MLSCLVLYRRAEAGLYIITKHRASLFFFSFKTVPGTLTSLSCLTKISQQTELSLSQLHHPNHRPVPSATPAKRPFPLP